MPQKVVASGQDWKPQVFNVANRPGSGPAFKVVSGEKALKVGAPVTVTKKMGPVNVTHTGPGANAKKLDEDHETLKHKTLDHNVRVNIMKGRTAKGWNQTEFAQKINERDSVVKEYESGKAIPNEQVLVRMEKVLGMHLRGVKAGQPL